MSPEEIEAAYLRRAIDRSRAALREETDMDRRKALRDRIRNLEELLQQVEAGPRPRQRTAPWKRFGASQTPG